MANKKEITGTVSVLYSSDAGCVCCKGYHVTATALDISFVNKFPKHLPKSIDNWLKSSFDFRAHEGKRIKITAEFVD